MPAHRRFEGPKLVVASHNDGKVREIGDLLAPFGFEAVSAKTLNLPEPEETADTFAGNAELKALAAAKGARLPALADDSGLAVTALGGAPGIYSARWAETGQGSEGGRDFRLAMERVNAELDKQGATDRSARFVCVLSLAWPGGHVESFEGEVQGQLTWPPRGGKGFGYDPIFVPDGHTQTFGEFDPAAKHAISHRADAFRKLIAACFPAHS